MDTLTFDIETIPQQNVLSEIQQEELDKLLEKYYTKQENISEEEKQKQKRLTMATSPFFGEIICIGLYRTKGKLYDSTVLVGTEKEILTKFWNILNSFKGTFISFNGLNFDIPFILKRSMYHKIYPTNNDFLDMKRFSKKPHFDVKMVFGDWNSYAHGSLRLISDHFGIQSPKEGSVKAENVEEEYLKGNIKEIAEYCLKDVMATYKIYLEMNKYSFQHKYQSI